MKILFASSEVSPFSRAGGLADVSCELSLALARMGHEVFIVTPKYRQSRNVKSPLETPEYPSGGPYLLDEKNSPNFSGQY